MLRIWYLVQLSLVLNLGNFQLELKDVIRNSTLLKVSISKKQFFLKPYYPKKEQNIRQNFWVMEFQEKMLLRLTDL